MRQNPVRISRGRPFPRVSRVSEAPVCWGTGSLLYILHFIQGKVCPEPPPRCTASVRDRSYSCMLRQNRSAATRNALQLAAVNYNGCLLQAKLAASSIPSRVWNIVTLTIPFERVVLLAAKQVQVSSTPRPGRPCRRATSTSNCNHQSLAHSSLLGSMGTG